MEKEQNYIDSLYNETEKQELDSILKWSEPKPAMKEYKTEALIAFVAFIFFAVIASIIAAPIVAIFNIYSPWCFAFVPIFLVVYFVEYHNLTQVVRRYLLRKSNHKIMLSKSRIIAACLISGLNIFVVLFGATELMKSEKKDATITLRNVFSKDSINMISEYNSEKIRIENAIKDTKKSYVYNGVLSYKGASLIASMEQDLKELRTKKDADLIKFESKNDTMQVHEVSKIDTYFWLKLLFSLVIEIILIGCAYFRSNYKMTVYFETKGLLSKDKSINKNVKFDITNESKEFIEQDTDKKKVTGHSLWHLQ